MEPSCTNLSLPRFASIRHGFELPANPNRILAGSFDNRFLGDSYRRESADRLDHVVITRQRSQRNAL
jgi:hypothetical protein